VDNVNDDNVISAKDGYGAIVLFVFKLFVKLNADAVAATDVKFPNIMLASDVVTSVVV
jgi:hypothetical protein